jgi:UTP--glucose-1-phosphate uridylyltransferase
MLPIVDKPLIQYAVEEAIAAGAEKLVFITGSSKRAIEDHFDTDPELERQLADIRQARPARVDPRHRARAVTCIFVRQGVPLGLGHAVLCAQAAVGNEPFFVHLADDLIYSDVPCLQQMAQHYEKHGASVLGVETVPRDQTGSYGIVAVETENRGRSASRKLSRSRSPPTRRRTSRSWAATY